MASFLQIPRIHNIQPSRGPVSGGTIVNITGSHLDAGSNVSIMFKDQPCTYLRLEHPTRQTVNYKHRLYKRRGLNPLISSRHPCRRGGLWLTCRTHASLQGYGNVSVSVSIDRAHLQKDLRFEYVEDPTITKIEPEWSIYRYGTTQTHNVSTTTKHHIIIFEPCRPRLVSRSGHTPVTVTGTNLDIIQTPLIRAKYNNHETLNVSDGTSCH